MKSIVLFLLYFLEIRTSSHRILSEELPSTLNSTNSTEAKPTDPDIWKLDQKAISERIAKLAREIEAMPLFRKLHHKIDNSTALNHTTSVNNSTLNSSDRLAASISKTPVQQHTNKSPKVPSMKGLLRSALKNAILMHTLKSAYKERNPNGTLPSRSLLRKLISKSRGRGLGSTLIR